METLTNMDLESLKLVDVQTVEKESLVDLNTVCIDDTKPVPERISSFLEQIKNPYCFRIGDIVVKVNYKPTGPTFQQNFEELLRTS